MTHAEAEVTAGTGGQNVLFKTEGHHGINRRSSSGRQIASECCHREEQNHGGKQSSRVRGTKAKKEARDQVVPGKRRGDSDGDAYCHQPKAFAHYQPQHLRAAGAKGHAKPNLVYAPGDHIGHEPVEPDAREKNRQEPKERGELRD
jgi:hypothetical protein